MAMLKNQMVTIKGFVSPVSSNRTVIKYGEPDPQLWHKMLAASLSASCKTQFWWFPKIGVA